MLDGLSTQEEIAALTAEQGNPAFAQTDHGFVAGTVSAYKAAQKYGVKFIPGVETYVCNDHTASISGKQRSGVQVKSGEYVVPPDRDNGTYHMLLLAKNQTGLHNLYNLSSEGCITGNRGRNAKRVTNEHLEKFSSGLIGTSGCLGSRVSAFLRLGRYDKALEQAAFERDVFGDGNYYIEIQNHNIDEQLRILGDQLRLAKDLGLPLVATNDSHYTRREDAQAHDHMLAINTRQENGNGGILTPDRFCFEGDEHYIKSADEMYALFPEDQFPGACSNTLEIAEKVEDINPLGTDLLIPEFEYADYGYGSTDEMLVDRARKGLIERMHGEVPEKYWRQMDFEIEVIRNMGIQSYFLIVAAIIEFCRESGITTGPGRGSAAGSIVVYALGITKVDPIEHDLIFSRFLNAGRTDSMPDIDLDIETKRRSEVVDFMAERWGSDRVVNIAAFQTFKAKSALDSVGRVHEVRRNGEVRNFSSTAREMKDLISNDKAPLSVLAARERPEDPERAAEWDSGQKLREFLAKNGDPEVATLFDVSSRLDQHIRGDGIHPAGVLITPGPARELFPLRAPKDSALEVCQFNCGEVDDLNGLKMDLLGLTNLTLLEAAVKKIRRDCGVEVDLDNVPFDDEGVYSMLRRGDTTGIFQIESSLATDLIRKIQPTCFDDISALIALGRPGPMEMDSHNEYARRKNGQSPVTYFHEDAEPILSETYGLVVYQEQVMRIAQKFAGFTEKEADDFRKAMGKKKRSVMEQQHGKFIDGVVEHGYTRELGQSIWDTVEPFAGYAFNKAHSVAYGYITYETAWLKANFYPQFAAAFIDTFGNKAPVMISDAIARGYSVTAPDVNSSYVDARSTDSTINVGFNRVAAFGTQFSEGIATEREASGKYTSILDFCTRNPQVKKNSLTNLIKAGAFATIKGHEDRIGMLDAVEDIVDEGKKRAKSAREAARFSSSLFSLGDESETTYSGLTFDFSRHSVGHRQRRLFESEALGFFVGTHPFEDFNTQIDELRDAVPALSTAVSVKEAIDRRLVGRGQFYGVLTKAEETTSSAGKEMTRYTLDCGEMASVDGIVMGHGHVCADDLLSLVLVDGRMEEDTFVQKEEEDDDTPPTLRFSFGAKLHVIKSDADSDVLADGAQEIEGHALRKVNGNGKGHKHSSSTSKKQAPDRRSGRSTRRNRATQEERNEAAREGSARMVTMLDQRRASKVTRKVDEEVLVSFSSESRQLSDLMIQHIALVVRNLSDDTGRSVIVVANTEHCPTQMLVPSTGMTALRHKMNELATLCDVRVSVSVRAAED